MNLLDVGICPFHSPYFTIFLCQTLLLLKMIWNWKHLPNWIGTLDIQLPEMDSYGKLTGLAFMSRDSSMWSFSYAYV